MNEINPKDYFVCNNGVTLTSLNDLMHEFEWYSKGSSLDTFKFHMNNNNNDFANWVSDVFKENILAEKMRSLKNPNEIFILIEQTIQSQNNSGDIDLIPLNQKIIASSQRMNEITSKLKKNSNKQEFLGGEKLFKLKESYENLIKGISSARKDGKDVFIVSLRLRMIKSKLGYYVASGDDSTYDELETLLNEAKVELDDSVNEKELNIKKEILDHVQDSLVKEV